MKRLNIIAAILILVGITTGCSEDFFDKTPTKSVTPSDLGDPSKDPSVLQSLVNGMYLTLFTSGTGGSTAHSDFGQKMADITTDQLSGIIAQTASNYGHFYENEELKSATRTNNMTYRLWRYNYRLIKASNDILRVYGNDQTAPAEAEVWGQAKAVRAWAYLNLVNLFAKNYQDDLNKKVLPLYGINDDTAQPLSTLQEVMAFVRKDAEDAVAALSGFTRSYYNEIDETVANGILAYVYLTIGEDALAITTADKVIAASALSTAADVTGGFNTVGTKGWLWAANVTNENTGSLVTFWGHVDYFTYSYAYAGDRKVIDEGLYAAIEANDVRRAQFHAAVGLPMGKFYDAGRTAGGDRAWENDIFWMRVAEMYLVKAEAQTNTGGDAAGTLNALLANRAMQNGTASIVGTTPAAGVPTYDMTDIKAAVYLQWNIECWGEGRSLWAMKRMKRSFTRGARHPELPGATISYNDDRLTFPIPENEAINNPNIQ